MPNYKESCHCGLVLFGKYMYAPLNMHSSFSQEECISSTISSLGPVSFLVCTSSVGDVGLTSVSINLLAPNTS